MAQYAKIKQTGERIVVYRLNNGNYFDYEAMGANEPPKSRLGKKEFRADELELGDKILRT